MRKLLPTLTLGIVVGLAAGCSSGAHALKHAPSGTIHAAAAPSAPGAAATTVPTTATPHATATTPTSTRTVQGPSVIVVPGKPGPAGPAGASGPTGPAAPTTIAPPPVASTTAPAPTTTTTTTPPPVAPASVVLQSDCLSGGVLDGITVSWSASPGATGYRVLLVWGQGLNQETWTLTGNNPPAPPYNFPFGTVLSLEPFNLGYTYEFAVEAFNSSGTSAPSPTHTIVTTGC